MSAPLRLIRHNTVPPGGFKYLQAETKHWIRAAHIEALERLVIEHRKANQIPVGTDIRGEIEQQICASLGPEWCNNSTFTQKVGIAWRAVVQGTTTLVDWLIQGGRKVSAEEADQRAAICAVCPENRVVDCVPCNSQKLVDVMGLFPTPPIPHGKYLKSCAVCTCMLEKKVWVPQDILLRHIPAEQIARLPSKCWVPKPEPKTA